MGFAVGIDSVEAMVQLAVPTSNVVHAVATAECLPFAAESFDLLTVSSGIHWFDQQAFFAEAARVLTSGGWLAVYDHFFQGSGDEAAIDDWLKSTYAERYPSPRRGEMADGPIAHDQFLEVEPFEYDDAIPFTHDELVSYLLSHSNTIAPATEGRETPQETERWLRSQTAIWFDPPGRRTFRFHGTGRCLKLRS